MAKDQNTIYHDTGDSSQQEQQQQQHHSNTHNKDNEQFLLLHNISYNEVATNGEAAFEATHINRGPFFDVTASRNVTALVGRTAYLNCRVHNLNNKTVS